MSRERLIARLPESGLLCLLFFVVLQAVCWAQGEVELPGQPGTLRFAVIGDAGTGGQAQRHIARQMAAYHDRLPYGFVLMLGDNLYGSESRKDYQKKFEKPYQGLLERGVMFYAVLGNHDEPEQRFYPLFHMNGKRYYNFTPIPEVELFALDSTQMDDPQLRWLEEALQHSTARWKICFLHHPLYSSGKRHGSDRRLQDLLEPLFVRYGVTVVFAGHDHFYERLKPQKGVHYFTSGSGAKLRRGNIRQTPLTARGFDEDHAFLMIEVAGNEIRFRAVSRTGQTVDFGLIHRKETARQAATTTP